MSTIIDDLKLNKTSILDLELKIVNAETIVEIAKMLSINKFLHVLRLSHNNVGVEGAIRIAKMLSTNTSLHTLDFWNTTIEANGAIEIAKNVMYKYIFECIIFVLYQCKRCC